MFGQPVGVQIIESTVKTFGVTTKRIEMTFGQVCSDCRVIHGSPQMVITEVESLMGQTTKVEQTMPDGAKITTTVTQMGVQLPMGGFMAMGPLMILVEFEAPEEPIESAEELLVRWRKQMNEDEAGFSSASAEDDWLDAEIDRLDADLLAMMYEDFDEPPGMSWEEFEAMMAEEEENRPDGTPVENWETPDGFN